MPDGRAVRAHIASLARRGDPEAIELLQGPPFPRSLRYLFDRFAELLVFSDGRPTWKDLQPWAALMHYAFSPWELRALRQISDAFFASQTEAVT